MPSSNRGAHPYQRFIPREEVQAVTAWAFEPVDEAERQAAQPADEGPPPIDAAQLEAERARAFAEGFEQGRQTGAQEAREALQEPLRRQTEEHAARIAALLAQAQQQLELVQRELADEILLLACDIARQVVRRELQQPLAPVRACRSWSNARATAPKGADRSPPFTPCCRKATTSKTPWRTPRAPSSTATSSSPARWPSQGSTRPSTSKPRPRA
jgi:hypothetical protein